MWSYPDTVCYNWSVVEAGDGYNRCNFHCLFIDNSSKQRLGLIKIHNDSQTRTITNVYYAIAKRVNAPGVTLLVWQVRICKLFYENITAQCIQMFYVNLVNVFGNTGYSILPQMNTWY